jgi:hypothetical protein
MTFALALLLLFASEASKNIEYLSCHVPCTTIQHYNNINNEAFNRRANLGSN